MFGFSELEERLMGEDRAAVLQQCLARMDAITSSTKAALDAGLDPVSHQKAEAILLASMAAQQILRTPPATTGEMKNG